MDYWEAFGSEMAKADFGSNRIVFSTKASVVSNNRPHTSLSMIKNTTLQLGPCEATFKTLNEPEFRYIIATDMSFDTLITMYDVNSQSGIVIRSSLPFDKLDIDRIHGMLRKFKRPNLEMRIIGMQNGDKTLVKAIEALHKVYRGDLIEVDLFGNLKRHVALDLKTGICYDVLLIDRVYRAGELVNDITPDSFKVGASKLKFV
ncbi:MAG: hypothetical protein ACREBF_01135 [Candidatus Micrarchaeales archaeon]